MSGLLDFIQGASNAAAGAVAGPVDLINMGLLGVGLPMPRNPVGGSQWMRERGLMRDPQSRTMGLLGEAAGGVLPIVAAARAPQIAAGLLNHAEAYRRYHGAVTAPGAGVAQFGAPRRYSFDPNYSPQGLLDVDLYHGSNQAIRSVNPRKYGSHTGTPDASRAFWATDSPGTARNYAQWATEKLGGDEVITKLRASSSNPLVLARDGNSTVRGRMLDRLLADKKAAFDYAEKHGHDAIVWPIGNSTDDGFTVAVLQPDAVKVIESF